MRSTVSPVSDSPDRARASRTICVPPRRSSPSSAGRTTTSAAEPAITAKTMNVRQPDRRDKEDPPARPPRRAASVYPRWSRRGGARGAEGSAAGSIFGAGPNAMNASAARTIATTIRPAERSPMSSRTRPRAESFGERSDGLVRVAGVDSAVVVTRGTPRKSARGGVSDAAEESVAISEGAVSGRAIASATNAETASSRVSRVRRLIPQPSHHIGRVPTWCSSRTRTRMAR